MKKKQKSKLQEEYDQINNPTKSLDQIEKVTISDYEMIQGDYKVLITIYEAQELQPKKADVFGYFPTNKSAADAFVEVEVMGKTRKTAVRKETNNPIWQESFFFQFQNLSVQNLDTAKIIINVHDKNNFFISNSHIGKIEIDWTNIYFKRFHQIYRGWLTLSDPGQKSETSVGFLLCNIAVLGPQDKIMVHDTAFIKDPLTTIEDTITNVKVRLIDYSIIAQIYRAESLIPLDLFSRNVDAYVVAKFSGNKIRTKRYKGSTNPEWNQALNIGTGVPNKTKYLMLQVWNQNFGKKDDLIGTVKIPFIDICQNKYSTPRWVHIYGPPMCAKDQPPNNYVSKMQLYGEDLGSHYRGRLLFKVVGKKYVHSKNGSNQIKFKFPYKPTPVVALKTYTLSVDMIEGFQLPEKDQCEIIVSMGQYLMRADRKFYIDKEKRTGEFNHPLGEKKVQFPEDIHQVPDIIIYFCDGSQEKNRICFVRIKASTVSTPIRNKNSQIYELDGDKSLGGLKPFQIGGYLNARINLYTSGAPQVKPIEQELIDKISFQLFLYVYKGQDFPPAKIEGNCNPVLKFNCFGEKKDCLPVRGGGTYNPFWSEMVRMEVHIQDVLNTNITKGVVVEAFDHVDGKSKDQFIGSFLIRVNTSNLVDYHPSDKDIQQKNIQNKNSSHELGNINFIYIKPRWHYILNPHIEIGKHIFGKVLIGVALFKSEDLSKGKIPKYRYDFDHRTQQNQKLVKKGKGHRYKKMIETQTRKLQIYVIGIRNIKDIKKTVVTQGDVSLNIILPNKYKDQKDKDGKEQVINQIPPLQGKLKKLSGFDFNKLIQTQVDIPKNRSLKPFIDFKVKFKGQFYGFNSVSLYKLLPKLKQKEGSGQAAYVDSEDTILDVEGLQNQLNMLREKKRKEQAEKQGLVSEEKAFEELPVPMQLGNVNAGTKQEIDKEKQDFQEILKKAELDLKTNEDYNYVQKLKQEREKMDSNSKSMLFQKNMQKEAPNQPIEQNQTNTLNVQSNMGEIDNSDEKSHLIENKAEKIGQASRNSMSRLGSEANIPKGNHKVYQTAFQRLKKKQIVVKHLDNKQANNNTEPFAPKKNIQMMNLFQVNETEQIRPKDAMIQELPQIKDKDKDYKNLPGSSKDMIEGDDSKNSILKEKQKIQLTSQQIKNKQIVSNNNQQGMQDNYKDVENRFNNDGNRHDVEGEQQRLSFTVEVKTDQDFDDNPIKERGVRWPDVKRVMQQEEEHQREAIQRQRDYKFAQAVKLTLFGWNRKKKKRDIETYQDYDTEAGQNLDIVPQWYKGRKILTSDFQDLSFKCSKIQTIPLFGGRLLQKTTIYQRYKQTAGHVKLICLSEATEVAKEKEEEYTKLLKPKQYYVRIYCLKGKSLISHFQGKPTTYLKFTFGEDPPRTTEKKKEESNPEYYVCHEVQVNLPGPSVIKIEVIQQHEIFGKLIPRLLGYTELDVQLRYFTKKWHLYQKKPIQLRNLYSEYGIGSQGRLETWIDLIEKKNWINTPAHQIHPPPFDKYELRVIVWKTDDCVYKNVEMESNDTFVRGVIGTSDPQETDTHWACRSTGSFNYRFKFPVFYPPKPEDMYSDIFAIQIWDRDLIGFNNLIGETRINMNKMHKIIQKAVKRKSTIKASMKVKEKNFAITDRFWFDVYNHKEKDQFGIPQPQGRVQLGFQLVPFKKSEEEIKNGYGRSQPNVYPTLPDPQGRLQFDFFSPLSFLKQILGPNLYRKCCCKLLCCLLVVLLAGIGYIFLPTLLAVKI